MSGYALTPRARAGLKAIWTYTADHWSIEQADRYAGLLHHAMQVVAAERKPPRQTDHDGEVFAVKVLRRGGQRAAYGFMGEGASSHRHCERRPSA